MFPIGIRQPRARRAPAAPAGNALIAPLAARYFPGLPVDLKYLKNSELGSRTRTSFLFLKLCLYASRLR
jgi:hypothetical protein